MKVTAKNNRLIFGLLITNTICTFIIALLSINNVFPDVISWIILHATAGLCYIITISYLIGILQFAGEAITIQTPFSIFLGTQIIAAFASVLSARQQGQIMLTESLAMINIVVVFYIILVTFRIKAKQISTPYKIYGLSLVLEILLKFSFVFLRMPIMPERFIGVADFMPLFAIFYIVNRTGKLLNEHVQPVIN